MSENHHKLIPSIYSNVIENEKDFIYQIQVLLSHLHNKKQSVTNMPAVFVNMMDILSKILTFHQTIKTELEKSCKASVVFLKFMSQINLYLDYCCYLKRIQMHNQEILTMFLDETIQTDRLLCLPIEHIKSYEEVLGDLCKVLPECEGRVLNDICESLQLTVNEIGNIFNCTENTLKLLWIQKCLVKKQPKIFVPGRILLKEGILMKVSCNGRTACERVFFLFNDILLCCKSKRKTTELYGRSSLLCRCVIPLEQCSVRTFLTSKLGGESLFKIIWENNSYLLFSHNVGDSQTWIKDLQLAIRLYKKLLSDIKGNKGKCAVKRSTGVARKPNVKHRKSQSDLNTSFLKESQNASALSSQKSNLRVFADSLHSCFGNRLIIP